MGAIGDKLKGRASSPPPTSWVELNDLLRDADEAECEKLLAAELKGQRRKQFVLRIHSRLNRVRAVVERHDLLQQLGFVTKGRR